MNAFSPSATVTAFPVPFTQSFDDAALHAPPENLPPPPPLHSPTSPQNDTWSEPSSSGSDTEPYSAAACDATAGWSLDGAQDQGGDGESKGESKEELTIRETKDSESDGRAGLADTSRLADSAAPSTASAVIASGPPASAVARTPNQAAAEAILLGLGRLQAPLQGPAGKVSAGAVAAALPTTSTRTQVSIRDRPARRLPSPPSLVSLASQAAARALSSINVHRKYGMDLFQHASSALASYPEHTVAAVVRCLPWRETFALWKTLDPVLFAHLSAEKVS